MQQRQLEKHRIRYYITEKRRTINKKKSQHKLLMMKRKVQTIKKRLRLIIYLLQRKMEYRLHLAWRGFARKSVIPR